MRRSLALGASCSEIVHGSLQKALATMDSNLSTIQKSVINVCALQGYQVCIMCVCVRMSIYLCVCLPYIAGNLKALYIVYPSLPLEKEFFEMCICYKKVMSKETKIQVIKKPSLEK